MSSTVQLISSWELASSRLSFLQQAFPLTWAVIVFQLGQSFLFQQQLSFRLSWVVVVLVSLKGSWSPFLAAAWSLAAAAPVSFPVVTPIYSSFLLTLFSFLTAFFCLLASLCSANCFSLIFSCFILWIASIKTDLFLNWLPLDAK